MKKLNAVLALSLVLPAVSSAQVFQPTTPSVLASPTLVGGAPLLPMEAPAPVAQEVEEHESLRGSQPPSSPFAPSNAASEAGVAPTAAQQGFGEKESLEKLKREIENEAAMNTPRQKGLVIPAPTVANPVYSDAELKEWFGNWKWTLRNLGVSDSKIDFEAKRLNKTSFENWASRQMRHRQGDTLRLEVLERPKMVDSE